MLGTGNLEVSKALEIGQSYLGYLKYGDTYALRKLLSGHFFVHPSRSGVRLEGSEEWLVW